MPIRIPNDLPAASALRSENIFVMTDTRAKTQDIRPLKILLLNLMPTKIVTETQLARLLANSPLQVQLTFLQTKTHDTTHTPQEHMKAFYKTFDAVRNERFDGMIITGAPVEQMPFEEVDYWDELCRIMDWTKTNVYSTFHICWGAQAGLYYHYGIPKHPLSKKMFGVFPHRSLDVTHPLMRGLDDVFYIPHSRHTEILRQDIAQVKDLQILAYSDIAGVCLLSDMECRNFFSTGHSEYDRDTLAKEYFRDKSKGLDIDRPYNYFPHDDENLVPLVSWKSTASLIFSNWLNYFVYQRTPYDISTL